MGQEQPESRALERIVQTSRYNPRLLWTKSFLRPFAGVMSHFSARKAHVHIAGVENVIKDGKSIQGPALWLIKHEDWADFWHYPVVWKEIGKPPMNAVSRSNYFGPGLKSKVASFLMRNTLFVEINRPDDYQDPQKAREHNRKIHQKLLEYYQKGIQIVIAPEGTTKSDGSFQPIKGFAYRLSHIRDEKGIYRVPIVAVGNTYDYFTPGKPRVFFRIGKVFTYEPLVQGFGEPFDHYIARDIAHHKGRVLQKFANLNTITASQLICSDILTLAERGESRYTLADAIGTMERHMAMIMDGPWAYDPQLSTQAGQIFLTTGIYKRLEQEGFILADTIDLYKVLSEPEPKDFKKENLLKYQANRLRSAFNLA